MLTDAELSELKSRPDNDCAVFGHRLRNGSGTSSLRRAVAKAYPRSIQLYRHHMEDIDAMPGANEAA